MELSTDNVVAKDEKKLKAMLKKDRRHKEEKADTEFRKIQDKCLKRKGKEGRRKNGIGREIEEVKEIKYLGY